MLFRGWRFIPTSENLLSAATKLSGSAMKMNIYDVTAKTLVDSVRPQRIGSGIRRFVGFGKQINFYYFWEKRWFFISLVIGAILLNIDRPEGLSREGLIVLTMSIMATILFVTEPVPLPTVALMIIAGQVLLLGLDSTNVAKSLMTDSVLFIMGSLMLAVAVVKQKLDKRIAWLIVRLTGTKTR